MKNINEKKYPVKYALMPIRDRIGWIPGLNELEGEYEVVIYLVSKCYVISEEKKYLEDGSYKLSYEVVFPFQRISPILWEFEIQEPSFNVFSRKCINSIIVDQLFDSFDEILEVVKQKNNELKRRAEVKEKQEKNLNKYKELEQQIQEETKDMIVITSLDEVINKVIENPRDLYIKITEALSMEEREYLKELIENKSCMNCSNGTCKVETSEKSDNESCVSWDNKELIGREKVLSKNR